jgi:hypothetical protein
MTRYHWGGMLVLLLLGYFVGVWYPGPGAMVRAKIGV